MAEFRKVHQFLVFSCNTPIQYALAEYLKQKENYLSLGSFYQQKRDYFIDAIKNSKFEFTPAAGTYFQLLRYKKLSQEKDTEYAIRLTKEFGIASIPISVFYRHQTDNSIIRFCFAKEEETLKRAAEKISKM